MSSRVTTARSGGGDSGRVLTYTLLGALIGLVAGLFGGLFLAIPLAQVLIGGRDVAFAVAVTGGLVGAASSYRMAAGRPLETPVVFGAMFRKQRPDAQPVRQEPPRFTAPAPDGDEEPMADPRQTPAPFPASTELNALLGRGSEFDGKLSFEGTVRIDGTFTGEITTSDTLIVGESAKVQAEITCGTLVVNGEITGNIRARSGVELHRPARVKGDIHSPSLMIEKGVVFEGSSKMEGLEGSNVVPIQRASGETL